MSRGKLSDSNCSETCLNNDKNYFEEKPVSMSFEDILTRIGGFGKYQKIQLIIVAIPALVIALQQYASVFLAATPDFRCAIPSLNGSDVYSLDDKNQSSFVSQYIPFIETSNGPIIDSCHVYTTPGNSSSPITECDKYVYSTEFYERTAITEWNLVCKLKFESTMSTMVFMAGRTFAAAFHGVISDIVGRKLTMMVCIVLLGPISLAAAFSPNFAAFVVLRTLTGVFGTAIYMSCFVLGMEIIGKEYRMGVGFLMAELFGVGLIVLAVIGFLSRNWIYTQLAISVPTLLFFFYFWLVPESPRWLLSRNRVSEAKAVILKAAKFNKVQLPNNFELEQEKTTTSNIKSLLKAKTLLARTLVTFLNWFTVAMAYYGLSLSAGTMEGNVYFITGLSGVMECLGVLAALPINKLGRKGPYIFGMMLGGVACLAPVIVDKFGTDLDPNTRNNIYVVLNAIGKFGVSFAFCVIYIWSAEYYPTCLRTSLMGFSSTFARIGTIVSPFIAEIGKYVPPDQDKMLQSLIVGTITIGSGLTALILPETTGQSIPDTVEQANRMVSMPVNLFKKKTGNLKLDEKFNYNDE